MFLFNKMDRWKEQGYTIAHFIEACHAEAGMVGRLKIPVIYHDCSALLGTNFDEAIKDFIKWMLP